MRIKRLHMENFKLFKSCDIDFSDRQVTVLIGRNGTGKTTILEALAVAIGGFLSGFDEVKKTRHIYPDEVRMKKSGTNVEKKFPVKIYCEAVIGEKHYHWERSLNGLKKRTTRSKPADIRKLAETLTQSVRAESDIILPVFAFYGTGRLWSQIRDREIDLSEQGSRFLGYDNCLEPNSDEKQVTKWFKRMALIEFQEKEVNGVYKAVRNAIQKCLESLEPEKERKEVSVFFSGKTDEVEVRFGNDKSLPVRLLSDGYRTLIGMVADIAYRMAVLNPHLQESITTATPGVILIDEIDLHLHPKWQREILPVLTKIFPLVQFIVTTHSPFIVQSLNEQELVVLQDINQDSEVDVVIERGQFFKMSIEDITEYLMGIDLPQVSRRRLEMMKAAEEYYRTLQEMKQTGHTDQVRLAQLRAKLDKLQEPFADDIAFSAFLKQERLYTEAELGSAPDDATR
jgi:predicted ATP-binding protein involved in virulence